MLQVVFVFVLVTSSYSDDYEEDNDGCYLDGRWVVLLAVG